MSEEIILITQEQLQELVREAFRAELKQLVADKQDSDTDEILTSDEVLTLLKISPSYLITLRSKGLPHYFLTKGVIRYKRKEVLSYMQATKQKS